MTSRVVMLRYGADDFQCAVRLQSFPSIRSSDVDLNENKIGYDYSECLDFGQIGAVWFSVQLRSSVQNLNWLA